MRTVRKIAIVVFATLVILCIGIVGIILVPTPYKNSTYGMYARQNSYLKNAKSPKMIYVSGSSGRFGIDANYIEKKTGKTFVNLGNYAGYENDFVLNTAMANANKGDIILLAYENVRWTTEPDNGDAFAQLASIDVEPKMIRYLSFKDAINILRILPTALAKKMDFVMGFSVMEDCSDSFDEHGNYIGRIEECTIAEDNKVRDMISISKLNSNNMKYMEKIAKKARKKGVKILLVSPPTLKEASVEPETIDKAYQYIAERVGVEYISKANNHLFSRKYMADSIWHCNRYGREINTENLIIELKQAKQID